MSGVPKDFGTHRGIIYPLDIIGRYPIRVFNFTRGVGAIYSDEVGDYNYTAVWKIFKLVACYFSSVVL